MSKLAHSSQVAMDPAGSRSEPTAGHVRSPDERSSSTRVTQLNPHTSLAADPPVKSGLRSRIALALLIAAAAVGFAVWVAQSNSNKAAADAKAKVVRPLELATVDVVDAQRRVLTRTLPLSGSVAPLVQATVKAKVGGEVQQITVYEGQDLTAGAVIARIDTRNLNAQYARELAAVDKARADLELAKLNRDKNRTLLDQRFISQNTFESSESTYAGSAANLKLAQAQALMAKISLDDSVVRAPFAGTVAKRLIQQGEKVSPDTPMIALVDLREMLLEAAVPAADIPAVHVGQSVRFTVGGFGERQFEGTVQRINPVTAENSRSIKVYIAVANADQALKGGMFAQGQLLLSASDSVLAIPQAGVRSESGVSVVYTLQDGKIARHQVTTGAQNEASGYVEITSGLNAGERVIVADISDRKPGDAAFVRGENTAASK